MSIQRQKQLVTLLQSSRDWQTASDLADRLGVSDRSIRNYVAAVNAASSANVPIEASSLGYRLVGEPELASDDPQVTPETRRRSISRRLVSTDEPLSIFELADELFLSSATVEADIAKVRADLAELGVSTRRSDHHIFSVADEQLRRQSLYLLLQDRSSGGFDLAAIDEQAPGAGELIGPLRRALTTQLEAAGESVNDFVMTGSAVLAAVVHARAAKGMSIAASELVPREAEANLIEPIGEAVFQTLGSRLPAHELVYLARALLMRGAVTSSRPASIDPRVVSAVRAAVTESSEAFGVEPLDDEFLLRLAAHVERLRERSSSSEVSRNPLTQSIKSTYPLLFEVAVSVASNLADRLDISIYDDEIAYLALHIGGQWERNRQRMARPSAVLVSPGYYQLHTVLRDNIDRAVGSSLQLLDVRTDQDVDWNDIEADIVLTTVQAPRGVDGVVQISPFLTENDIERVHIAIARARRTRRRSRLRDELTRYILPSAFVPHLGAHLTPADVIRRLGDRLIEAGAIDNAYVESTLERERASSTAFTPTLAVPHAQTMSASRTAVAIGLAESSLAWGEGTRVQVVALVAFSETDREAFQTIFEQFVDVFTDADAARRLIKASATAETFVAELAAIIDA